MGFLSHRHPTSAPAGARGEVRPQTTVPVNGNMKGSNVKAWYLFSGVAMVAASAPAGIVCAAQSGSLGGGFGVALLMLVYGAARIFTAE